ncbi:PIN domain-containing protein [Streptomyces microflavus]|uniref:PIN domain-containing protein n=1 Tax=Streptomyces microflavus TaxID=1919 RepID=UPI00381E0718
MIILDTCVIRGMRLDSSDADLLRAIRETETERVGVPWMVMEERVAQRAVEHVKAHKAAAEAYERLQRETPWTLRALGDDDAEEVRKHWRSQLSRLVEVLPTSETALREAVYREANALAPATTKKHPDNPKKVLKIGARDVAIWLSAVEYARENPEETVYFVSSNHRDFTTGRGPYPHPMDRDVEGLGDRFVHLTRLADVVERIAPSVEVADEQIHKLLPDYVDFIRDAAMQDWGRALAGAPPRFPALSQAGVTGQARGWLDPRGSLRVEPLDVTSAQAYRLGDEEWCIAVVRWRFVGASFFDGALTRVCCTWSTRLLMPLARSGSNPRILSAERPQAPVDDQGVEWPAGVSAESVRRFRNLMSTADLATRLGSALGAFAQALPSMTYDREAVARFLEEERLERIAMDAAASAAQEAADEERAAEGYEEEDLWLGLDER